MSAGRDLRSIQCLNCSQLADFGLYFFQMFNIYIKRAAEVYGVTHTRSIYEKAIEVLPDDQARDMCLRFADLERKLGEIDRARAIYAHCSQICDPRVCEVWT